MRNSHVQLDGLRQSFRSTIISMLAESVVTQQALVKNKLVWNYYVYRYEGEDIFNVDGTSCLLIVSSKVKNTKGGTVKTKIHSFPFCKISGNRKPKLLLIVNMKNQDAWNILNHYHCVIMIITGCGWHELCLKRRPALGRRASPKIGGNRRNKSN